MSGKKPQKDDVDQNTMLNDCVEAGVPFWAAVEAVLEAKRSKRHGKEALLEALRRKDAHSAEQFERYHTMQVRTSRNTIEPFERSYIVRSLAAEAGLADDEAARIAAEVEAELRKLKLKYLSAPLIREFACVKLLEHGLEATRKAYTRVGMPVYDVTELIENGSNENANLMYNPETVHKLMADKIAKEYALVKAIPGELADAHMRGEMHIHDLEYFVTRPFCFSHDLRFFLKRGLRIDGSGKHTAIAAPAKRAEVALLHAAKVLAAAQVNCAGGQGFNWFNTLLAPFVEGMNYKKVRQLAQMFIFEMSQTYVSRGGQTVFSSIDVDIGVPAVLRDVKAVLPGGITNGATYGDYEDETRAWFRALCDVYAQGDSQGKPFSFPKFEIKVAPGEMGKNAEEHQMLSELAAKFGTPYYIVQQPYMPEYACYQSLPHDEKVFVVENDELKIVRIGGYVEELMEKQKVEKARGLEGEVELSEGAGFALSFNPKTLNIEKKKIGKVMRHKTKESVFRFILDTNRTISATAKHKVHVLRENTIAEVRAEEIRKGDFLIGLKNLDLDFAFDNVVEYKNKKIKIDEDFARLLGYFASEGYLHLANKKNRCNKVCFSFHEGETGFIEDVEKILREKFELEPKRDISKKNKTITVYVYDKCVSELFANVLKTGFDAHSKRVPGKILSAPREIIKEFMLGLFRGDGYFKNSGRIKIDLHLCNKELIEDTFALSLRIGIPMDYYEGGDGEGNKSYSLRLTSFRRITDFLDDVPFNTFPKTDGGFSREFDFYDRLPSKPLDITRENLKKGDWNRAQIGKRITTGRLEFGDNLFSRFAESDLHLFEVKNVEEVKSEYVYDFVDVGKYHNFANACGIFSSNCCAFLMDLPEMTDANDLQEGSVRGGALQVVTLNLPRIAYESAGSDARLFELLGQRMDAAKRVLQLKQQIIKRNLKNGLLPFLAQPVGDTPYLDVDRQSLVIGFVGLNEMLRYHTGSELHESDSAWRFGLKTIREMKERVAEFRKETQSNFALARTPAESCSHRFALIDSKRFADAIVQGDVKSGAVYYTNSFHVRPSADIPLFERLQREGSFHALCDGGCMSHVWLGEAHPDTQALGRLTQSIAKKTAMQYFAYTQDLTVCGKCDSTFAGVHDACQKCGSADVEWYSRITGYYQRVKQWNAGKRQEFTDRRRYALHGA